MIIPQEDLQSFLDEKYQQYNQPTFIDSDPIGVAHRFSKKEDIEIIGFLAATIAWGQRVTIINNSLKFAELMDEAPFDFIRNFQEHDLDRFADFKHRTFNGEDAAFFMKSLQHLYTNEGGLEGAFSKALSSDDVDVKPAIVGFRELFFAVDHPKRTYKHVSNPDKGSAAKRLNMYLRWMVRNDKCGVDFGIWDKINASQLIMPLDVHTGNVGRKLGLLKRKQNDWQSAEELTASLRKLDASDPVKYDFALFGLGVFEGF